MRQHLAFRLILAALFAVAALPAFSQVVPAARQGGFPLAIGGGYSTFDVDWGHGRMGGGTVWIDWRLFSNTPALSGFSIEGEARDISLGGSPTQPNLRQDTAAAGVVYAWPHFRDFQPFGKFLAGVGGEDFYVGLPYYHHDTRTIAVPGLGIEYRAFGHIWARAEYEYQVWEPLLSPTKRPDPQGITAGILYDFRAVHPR